MSFEDMADSAQDPKNLPVEFEFDTKLVRTIAKEGQAWFVAKDVCDILDHSNHRMAVAGLDDDEKGVSIIDSRGGPQETTIISESGLYSLIFTSRKEGAKRFRKWVTSAVLPAIRQTGRYVGHSEKDPDPISVWAKLLGVRPSDVITKGFDASYLTGGPINPSDYLVHNHRVLCHMVKSVASCWEGLHADDFDPRWSRREWSARRFTRQLQNADWLADRYLDTERAEPTFLG